MAGQLEAAHEQLTDEVADVQRIGGRIETDVQPDVALGKPSGEHRSVSGVVDQTTGVEFGKQIHSGAPCCHATLRFPRPIRR
jgi:hypothetical protein